MLPEKSKYILHIPSWFPNERTPYLGNFIEKHISAIAIRERSITLRVIPQKQPVIQMETVKEEGNITINYYYKEYSRLPLKLLSKIQRKFLYHKAMKEIEKRYGKPSLIHLHVTLPMGNFAKLWAEKWNLPLVLTEHWTIYQPQNRDKMTPALHRKLSKIYGAVTAYHTVSEDLQKLIARQFGHHKATVIPNVVDINKFYPKNPDNEKKTIIHISTLHDETKNFSGILKAIKTLSEIREDFVLKVIHENRNLQAERFVREHQLADKVIFLGSKREDEVAQELGNSDFLLLFSNDENLPCVIIEAFACGKPVITTNVGGIAEIVDRSRGIFVTTKNDVELAEKLAYMLDNYQLFDSQNIRKYAEENFSREKISERFQEFYRGLI